MCVSPGSGRESCFTPAATAIAMPIWLSLLVPALILRLPASHMPALDVPPKAYAKLSVIARGNVCPSAVEERISDMKRVAELTMDVDEVQVEIRRVADAALFGADMEASISTSLVVAMTTGASMAL